jgi:hypothetical protein
MFNLNIFKKPAAPDSQPDRCHFQHQNGRRCRLPVADETTPLCGTHRDMFSRADAQAKTREEHEAESVAILAEVYGPVKNLDSAVAIHHVLSNLFRLTLEGRIPQRKAALLTSMCRTLLKSVEAAHREISDAKLFPGSNPGVLRLLSLLNGESFESESDEMPSPAAVPPASNSITAPHPGHSVVVAGLGNAITHEILPPHSGPQKDGGSDQTSAPASIPPAPTSAPPASSHPDDHVIWIGHNLFNPNRSSSAFFKQTPVIQLDPLPMPSPGDAPRGETTDDTRQK